MGARDLLESLTGAGMSIAADGGRLLIRPASRLTDSMCEALRVAKPELLALLTAQPEGRPVADLAEVAWTDADIASFQARRDRLARWGWAVDAAEALAARLVKRDREHDERVCCADCSHYRPGVCRSYMQAGLQAADLGRDLAGTLQRCPAFNLMG